MNINNFPVGMEMDVSYPEFTVSLTLLSKTELKFEIREGAFARVETVDIQVVALANGLYIVSWKEASGATVTHVQDHDRGFVFSHATLANGEFLRMIGTINITRSANQAADDCPNRNRGLVHEAMTSLFQRHDASAVRRLYGEDYIQHNPGIPQGRDALEALVANLSPAVHYEPGLIIAENDLVAIHGRIRGWADKPQVVVDIFRVEGGKLVEHWDVLQDEVPPTASSSKISMFDPTESERGTRGTRQK